MTTRERWFPDHDWKPLYDWLLERSGGVDGSHQHDLAPVVCVGERTLFVDFKDAWRREHPEDPTFFGFDTRDFVPFETESPREALAWLTAG